MHKEYNVKRHDETKHACTFNKLSEADSAEKAKQLEDSLATQQLYFKRAHESNESITKASLEVALLVAKHSKPFAEGEFVETCVMKMPEHIFPQKKKDFANVCLTRNTVARRIEELSTDVRRQLGEKSLNFDFFSLACDESTDLSDTAQLLIFFRGVNSDMNTKKELLDLKSLKDQTRGADLFFSVCSTVDDMKLPWSKVSTIITDGASAMAGEQSGLSIRIYKKVSDEGGDAVKLHCIIHQQVLCAKHLPFAHVMKPVAKAINFIRSKALYHHQFQQFLHDIDAEYGDVLYHNDVRWLSMGSALQRFFSVRVEIGQFLVEKGRPMQKLSDTVWIADLAFLVDITKHLNALNISLQGQNAVVSNNVPSKSLLSVRGMKGCVSSSEYCLRQGSFGFLSQNEGVLSKKKRSSLRFHPQFPDFIPKM